MMMMLKNKQTKQLAFFLENMLSLWAEVTSWVGMVCEGGGGFTSRKTAYVRAPRRRWN